MSAIGAAVCLITGQWNRGKKRYSQMSQMTSLSEIWRALQTELHATNIESLGSCHYMEFGVVSRC